MTNKLELPIPRRRPAKLFGDGFSEDAKKLTTLSKYLGRETWTPVEAILLVCGIQPIEDCSEIPNGGMGLDNSLITGKEDAFHDARRILRLWNSRENPPTKIRPADFVAWCKTYDNDLLNQINTDWLSEIVEVPPASPTDAPVLPPRESAEAVDDIKTAGEIIAMAGMAVLAVATAKAEGINLLQKSPTANRLLERLVELQGKSTNEPSLQTNTFACTGTHIDHAPEQPILTDANKPRAAAILQLSSTTIAKTHKITNRTQPLDAEIAKAKETALNMDDPNSVWAELVKMAEKQIGCLLGPDENSIRYQSGDEVKFFKKRGLHEKMRRATPH